MSINEVPDNQIEPTVVCIRCQYDLRGLARNGCCPECGTPIAESSVNPRKWTQQTRRRVFTGVALALLGVVAVFSIDAFLSRISYGEVCLQCGEVRYRRTVKLAAPFLEELNFEVGLGIDTAKRQNGLPKLLDVSGQCPHRWVVFGTGCTWVFSRAGMGPNPSDPGGALDWDDVGEFLDECPWIVKELPTYIQQSISKGDYAVRDFLMREHDHWSTDKQHVDVGLGTSIQRPSPVSDSHESSP